MKRSLLSLLVILLSACGQTQTLACTSWLLQSY
jgi:hypothetical protein